MYLLAGIVVEVAAASIIPYTKGFTKLYPTLAVGTCYMVALYFLSLTTKTLPIPVTYAIWAGGGIVLLTTISMASGFTPNAYTVLGITMIVAGIVTINLLGGIH